MHRPHRSFPSSPSFPMPSRGAFRPALGLALVAALALVACGGSEAAPDTVPLVASTTAATPAPTASAVTRTPSTTPTPSPTPVSFFDADLHRLASKQHALGPEYAPADLRTLPAEWAVPGQGAPVVREAAVEPLLALLQAARADGLDLRIRSSYRSYATQQQTFQFWIDYLGEEQARRESAEPGHSEHQLGTTVDFASAAVGWELIPEFGDTREGQWLAARAWRYGFALSYPQESEQITGYVYEPWHFRYVGRAAAAAWRQSELTLIEFLIALHEDAGVPVQAGAPAEPVATATTAVPATAPATAAAGESASGVAATATAIATSTP